MNHSDMFCVSLFFRIVGGFETLTAMENVESDPKSDKPKVRISVSLIPAPSVTSYYASFYHLAFR